MYDPNRWHSLFYLYKVHLKQIIPSPATSADASSTQHDPIATTEQPTGLACRHSHTTTVAADNSGQFLHRDVFFPHF